MWVLLIFFTHIIGLLVIHGFPSLRSASTLPAVR
jgi:hypothetical protein